MAASSTEAKVALVTGSSSGIGEGVVKLLAEKGYKVAVCGSKKEKVDRVVAECVQLSPSKFEPLALVLDLSVAEKGAEAVRKTVEHFGRLDALVNNAGIFLKTLGSDPSSYEFYRQVMTINTDATVHASLAAVEHLKKTKGSMVFVSSVASTKPVERAYAYAMSKAAMTSFAKCLAIDLAPDIRVNIVSPGPIVTPIFERVGLKEEMVEKLMSNTTLLQRVGNTREVAETILFLLSEKATFILGHELVIDGGYTIAPSMSTVSRQIIQAKASDSI